MALQVEGDAARSFSASFELRGDAREGEFTLLSPLGNTVARLQWQPGAARLEARGENRAAASVDTLVAQTTGTAIPVAALFDWLVGLPTAVPGWEPDLTLLPHGRLTARRLSPPPAVDLRVAFER